VDRTDCLKQFVGQCSCGFAALQSGKALPFRRASIFSSRLRLANWKARLSLKNKKQSSGKAEPYRIGKRQSRKLTTAER
jgi:hypothetical protein